MLGIGNVRCAPAIVGSLSNYFGERPLEIRFWDADWERLDLFDRFARLCFHVSKCPHQLISTDESDEALDGARELFWLSDAIAHTSFCAAGEAF